MGEISLRVALRQILFILDTIVWVIIFCAACQIITRSVPPANPPAAQAVPTYHEVILLLLAAFTLALHLIAACLELTEEAKPDAE